MFLYFLSIIAAAAALVLGAVYFFQEYLIFHPAGLPRGFRYASEAEEQFIQVGRGIELNALHFKTENARGVVLYFHGNAGNLESWTGVSQDFLPLGYNVFLFDYRGYGKSTGRINSEEQLHADAKVVFDLVSKQYAPEKIVLFGRSLGSGFAVRLAAQHKIKALLLESPYFNLLDVAKVHYPFLPATLLLRYPLRNDLYLPKVQAPIFIMHGTKDEVIPWQSGRKLAALHPAAKMLVVEGGDHNNLSGFEIYRRFLADALRD